ncbi:PAS/PAC sensor signal transduction histidine kinase [Ktedonobacter racemifer DSM 44963]|uniref:histidine kinase n=2 Tax=Ktedonobacter racemifer TaxID=363277 RepID=D6TC00_KTERA|nr:PAS/PAC sensor signal transduction histidine kinase [Ktedonobacter racemifer DSM 44963]
MWTHVCRCVREGAGCPHDRQVDEQFYWHPIVQFTSFSKLSHHFKRLLEVRAGTHLRSQGWGHTCERDIYRTMSDTKQIRRLTPSSSETLITLLETLPGALFIIDDAATIVYANVSAQTLTGATREDVCGKPLWSGAPHLVSTALYQAVLRARQTRKWTEVEYRSPVTQTWFHAQLLPTGVGLAVLFQENTEPKRFQDALRQSEQKYLNLLESVSDRMAVLTPEGLVLEINQRPLADSLCQREEVVGKPFIETPWWSYDPAVQQQLHTAIEQASRGKSVHFEARIHPQEGWYLDLTVTMTPHLDADGHVEYLIYAGRDITARKRAEAELHALVDAIPQQVWTIRPDGYLDYCNQRWLDYTSLSIEQAQGDGWIQCLHPDDRQRIQDAWQMSRKTGMPFETEQRLRHGMTGTYRWFLVRALPVRDETGQIIKWFGTSTDIEEQKRAEQKLKESEERFRLLAETVPQVVWVARPDGQHEYTNQHWCDYTGLTLEQIQSDRWAQLPFFHPDDREDRQARWQHALDTGAMYEHEGRLRNGQTGEYRWFLTRGVPMRDEAGQIVKWFGTSTDIEEQKRTEEALRQSQKRASVLMNSNMIGINIIEGEQIVDANDTFLHMTGYTREDLRAGRLNWMRMTLPEYLARTRQAHQELAAQQSITYEKEYVCKDGSRLPVLVCGVVLQHHPFQGIAFILDNSARKELEQRKDSFISMASHELRNPLASLKMQTQLVRKRLEKQTHHEAAALLSRVEGPVKQLERLIGELLDVSKIQAGRLEYLQETVDLDALLHEVADTMQQLSPTHTIVVRGAVPCSLVGDKDRLWQAFTNLLSNAIKYSPDAETVEMDLSASAEIVMIRVRDHGLGIPREQCDKIFDRFYRVSGPRQRAIPGLGMGLYIVAEIVKAHGGTIMVDSAVGKGSTFTVTLPTRTSLSSPWIDREKQRGKQ